METGVTYGFLPEIVWVLGNDEPRQLTIESEFLIEVPSAG
jgi:hypothetical protein